MSDNSEALQEQPDPTQTPDLAAKIAKVMQSIDDLPKNGWNDYHKYEYSTDDDVMGEVRPAMAEHGLVAIPSVVDRQREKISTGPDDGDYTLHTDVTVQVTLIDADTGQQQTLTWDGEAQDGQDKGLYKAYTSAIKYLMLKLFLLSADTDVETHDAAGEHSGGTRGQPQEPSEAQIEYASDLYDKDVWTEQERNDLQARVANANKSQLSDLIDKMKQTVEERQS